MSEPTAPDPNDDAPAPASVRKPAARPAPARRLLNMSAALAFLEQHTDSLAIACNKRPGPALHEAHGWAPAGAPSPLPSLVEVAVVTRKGERRVFYGWELIEVVSRAVLALRTEAGGHACAAEDRRNEGAKARRVQAILARAGG